MDIAYAAFLDQSIEAIRATKTHIPEATIMKAAGFCVQALEKGTTILVCGNGGSEADASHIAGELVGRFLKNRKPLRCLCLSDNAAVVTAWANDIGFDSVYTRQVEAHGDKDGVLIAISTSGNSPNILKAAETARDMGMKVIGLTGQGGGKLAPLCDVLLDVPNKHTPYIQQAHVCLYHYLCGVIEARMAERDETRKTG